MISCAKKQALSIEMSQTIKHTDERYYANELKDCEDGNSENVLLVGRQVQYSPEFEKKLNDVLKQLYAQLSFNISEAFKHGEKVYTGFGGLALLKLLNDERVKIGSKTLGRARHQVFEAADECTLNSRISFLNGSPGILALAAVMAYKSDNLANTDKYIQKLVIFLDSCLKQAPDELLYGRAGYLYALLFVEYHLPNEHIGISIFKEVIDSIIESGTKLAKEWNSTVPLRYEWHDKEYIGAAHGYCGILHTLLLAYKLDVLPEELLTSHIKPTIDYVLQLQFPSKNLPSSVNSTGGDRLVQWCHGAPGAVHMAAEAYRIFKEKKYLDAAVAFGEVTWKRGLLKKGYSLCHGVAGNGYTFLTLYQLTGHIKHLHRATKFAEWCFSYDSKQDFVPDRPTSLFEGLGGVLHFLTDITDPKHARFPGVQL